jgi:two-component system capsular synthesis sensor histidine kinase RcsC
MMQFHAPAESAATRPDVSPEAIAALVAQGAAALRLPDQREAKVRSADSARIADHGALSLLVGVTHDMRSPLSSMLMLVERLRSGQAGPLTPTQERQLGLLYSATFELAAMTNDALDFARGTASSAGEAPLSFSITDLLRSVCQVVQPIAEEKGLLLRCSGPASDRRIGQPTILHRVLLNLVTNALKYTNSGTVTLTATAVGATSVCFQVDDSGRGMPEEVVALLATPEGGGPFFSGAFSGSGLGLGICRRLLGDLNSNLEIESLQPVGTRVQFTLALPAL